MRPAREIILSKSSNPSLAHLSVKRLLGSRAVAPFVFVLVELFTLQVFAHELDVDSLSVQIERKSGRVSGQFLLDPELTRPQGPETEIHGAEKEREQARLFSFVHEHVIFRASQQRLKLSLELRELYVKGGAVPGDSVLYQFQLPKGDQTLHVTIKRPLEALAVTTTVDQATGPAVLLTGSDPLLLFSGKAKALETQGAPPHRRIRSVLSQAAEHIWSGIIHIVPLGWDHILFVIALTLGSLGRYRRLILELSAFTLAHTVTLGLGALRVITIPGSVVEPLIALSITIAALVHLFAKENPRFRYSLAAGFGLLHGLGFAGALLDLGFSGGSFLLFLASFNLGVEFGQLAVVAFTLAVFWVLSRWPTAVKPTERALVLAIAACGFVVTLLRILG